MSRFIYIDICGRYNTFETTLASTIIDITLSDKLAVSVTDWTVVKDENFTDHNDITFKLETEKIILEKTRKWEKADWALFTDPSHRKATGKEFNK